MEVRMGDLQVIVMECPYEYPDPIRVYDGEEKLRLTPQEARFLGGALLSLAAITEGE